MTRSVSSRRTPEIGNRLTPVSAIYGLAPVDGCENTTESVLTSAFGLPNGEQRRNARECKGAHRGERHVNMSYHELQRNHVLTLRLRSELLAGYVEQLQDRDMAVDRQSGGDDKLIGLRPSYRRGGKYIVSRTAVTRSAAESMASSFSPTAATPFAISRCA
jgi:hypothetical protein